MIRFRLTVWNALVLCILTLGLAVATFSLTAYNLVTSVDLELAARLKRISFEVSDMGTFDPPPSGNPMGRDAIDDPNNPALKFRERMMDREKRDFSIPTIEFDANSKLKQPPPWDSALAKRTKVGEMIYSNGYWKNPANGIKTRIRVVSSRYRRPKGDVVLVQLCSNLEPTYAEIDRLGRHFLFLVPLTWLAAIGLGYGLTQRALKPVADLDTAAKAIVNGEGTRRLPIQGKDEISELASTINAIFDRDAATYDRLLRFTADASHELKSPVTTILGAATSPANHGASREQLLERLQDIERASRGLARTVDDLLVLARTDDGQLANAEYFSLASLAGEVSDEFVSRFDDRIHLDFSEHLEVWGDRRLITRALVNLIENAFKHGGHGAEVYLTGTTVLGTRELKPGETATVSETLFRMIEIRDTGVGIPAEDLPKIMDRFYQVDKVKSEAGHGGVGLGLSIVKSIVSAHKGTIDFVSAEGQGTTVRLTLPVELPNR